MSLLDLPVRRPVAVGMLFFGFVVLGVVAYQRIPLELMPPLEGDTLYVGFGRPNSEQEVVERDILLPLHARVSALPDVAESWGEITDWGGRYRVRFEPRTDMKVRELELQRIAADLQREQPLGSYVAVGSVQSQTAQFGSRVMSIHVTGDADRDTLFDLADQLLAPRLAAVPGVAQATATGGSQRRLIVNVDLARAVATGVTPMEVVGAVSRRAGNIRHVGNLESESGRVGVILDGRPSSVEAFANTRIVPGRPTQLKHVSETALGYAPLEGSFRVNGEEAVGIEVYKEQTANLVRLGSELRERIGELRGELAPMGIDLVIGDDTAADVEEQLGRLARLGLSGYLIAIAVLFLFLRQWRAVAVVAVSVPVSLLGALALLYLLGHSINMLTLGGLWLSVGLLIDNSIVVYEAVLRRLERGIEAPTAVRVGLNRTIRAILAASGTTAIVMLPAAILDLPVTVGSLVEELVPAFLLPLGASMLVAVGLVPVLAHRLAAPAAVGSVVRQRETREKTGGRRAPDPLRILFGGLVANAMRRPSAWLTGTGVAVVATILIGLPLALSNQAPADPEMAESVSFSASSVKGTRSVAVVADAVAELEQVVLEMEGVDTVISNIGEDSAIMTVNFVDLEDRPEDLTVSRVRRAVDEAAKRVPGIDVARPGEERGGSRGRGGPEGGGRSSFMGGAADEVVLSGPDNRALERLSDDLVARLESLNQVARAWHSSPTGTEEIWVQPNPHGFEAYELTVDEVLPGLRFAGAQRLECRALRAAFRARNPRIRGAGRWSRAGRLARPAPAPGTHRQRRRHRGRPWRPYGKCPPAPSIVHHNGRRETSVFYRLDASAPESGPARDALDEEIAAAIHSAPKPAATRSRSRMKKTRA